MLPPLVLQPGVSLRDVQIVPCHGDRIAVVIWHAFDHDRQRQLCYGRRCLMLVPAARRPCPSTAAPVVIQWLLTGPVMSCSIGPCAAEVTLLSASGRTGGGLPVSAAAREVG